MSRPVLAAAVLALSLLLGSVPFGVLITRIVSGTDVRRIGSGNIGATNVLRASGPAAAILTLLLDIAKGCAAVLIARAVGGGEGGGSPGPFPEAGALEAWAAFAAVAGHVFSPWLRFKGGKGVATAAGAVFVLSPALVAAGLAVFATAFAISRIVSLSSIAAILGAAAFAAIDRIAAWGIAPVPILPVAGICLLVMVRHGANIGRLLRGEERPLGARRPESGGGA